MQFYSVGQSVGITIFNNYSDQLITNSIFNICTRIGGIVCKIIYLLLLI